MALADSWSSRVDRVIEDTLRQLKSEGLELEVVKGQELRVNGRRYGVKPDYTCYFPRMGVILALEDEKTKRPVESIAKYWWLYERTSWREEGLRLLCYIVLSKWAIKEPMRAETVEVLGRALEDRHGTFKFRLFKGGVDVGVLKRALREDLGTHKAGRVNSPRG